MLTLYDNRQPLDNVNEKRLGQRSAGRCIYNYYGIPWAVIVTIFKIQERSKAKLIIGFYLEELTAAEKVQPQIYF